MSKFPTRRLCLFYNFARKDKRLGQFGDPPPRGARSPRCVAAEANGRRAADSDLDCAHRVSSLATQLLKPYCPNIFVMFIHHSPTIVNTSVKVFTPTALDPLAHSPATSIHELARQTGYAQHATRSLQIRAALAAHRSSSPLPAAWKPQMATRHPVPAAVHRAADCLGEGSPHRWETP